MDQYEIKNTEERLRSTMNPHAWADEFISFYKKHPGNLILSEIEFWFAAALMTGWDHAHAKFQINQEAEESYD